MIQINAKYKNLNFYISSLHFFALTPLINIYFFISTIYQLAFPAPSYKTFYILTTETYNYLNLYSK